MRAGAGVPAPKAPALLTDATLLNKLATPANAKLTIPPKANRKKGQVEVLWKTDIIGVSCSIDSYLLRFTFEINATLLAVLMTIS